MRIHDSADERLATGRELFDQGLYEEANVALVEGLGIQPENPLLHYWKGLTESRLGRFALELACYDEAIRLAPYFPEAYFTRGFANLRQNNFHGAIVDYATAASLNPELASSCAENLAKAWAGRGEEFRRAGAAAKELVCYQFAIERDPSNALWYRNRGNLYLRQEEFELAISDLNTSVGLNSRDALAYMYRSMAHAQVGEHARGLDDVMLAVSIDPRILGTPGEDEAFPLAFTRSLVTATLAGPQAAVNAIKQNSDMILFLADKTVELAPDAPAGYGLRGFVYYITGDPERALLECNAAAELAPDSSWCYFLRANAHWLLDEDEKAIADCDTCTNLAPEHPDGYYLRGTIRSLSGDHVDLSEAATDLTRALDLYGESFASARALCHLARARAFGFQEDPGRCIEDSTECLRLCPEEETGTRVEALTLRSNALMDQEEFSASIDDASEGLQLLDGDDAEQSAMLHRIRAEAWEGIGEPDRAAEDYNAVIRLSSDPGFVEEARSRRSQIGGGGSSDPG